MQFTVKADGSEAVKLTVTEIRTLRKARGIQQRLGRIGVDEVSKDAAHAATLVLRLYDDDEPAANGAGEGN